MGRGGIMLSRALTMRCTIAPRTAGSTDADNRPVVGYGTPVTGVACRLMERNEQLIASTAQAGTIVYDKKVLLPASAAVQPFDQLTAFARPDPAHPGSYLTFDDGPYIVREVLDRADDVVQFRTALLTRAGGV